MNPPLLFMSLLRRYSWVLNRAVALAWRNWSDAVQMGRDERAEYEELVGRAVRKMINRQIAGAFEHWKALYIDWVDYIRPKLRLAAGQGPTGAG